MFDHALIIVFIIKINNHYVIPLFPFYFILFFSCAGKKSEEEEEEEESESPSRLCLAHQKGRYRFQQPTSKHCFLIISSWNRFSSSFNSLLNPCSSRSDQALGFLRHCMHGCSGCLGCYKKPTLINTVESKRFSKQGRAVKKPSTSEDFWTTSTHDMDNSAVQSQGSISSTSVINQAPDPHGGSGKTSNSTEFVNHGLILWNQTRQQWVGNRKSQTQTQQLQEPRLSWNATYESLLGSSKPFPRPIPLPEMVDFLVDIWEQEGLYD